MLDVETRPIPGVVLYLAVNVYRDPRGALYCTLEPGVARYVGRKLMEAADAFERGIPPWGGPVEFRGAEVQRRGLVATPLGLKEGEELERGGMAGKGGRGIE